MIDQTFKDDESLGVDHLELLGFRHSRPDDRERRAPLWVGHQITELDRVAFRQWLSPHRPRNPGAGSRYWPLAVHDADRKPRNPMA
jgi:hypothetical protein